MSTGSGESRPLLSVVQGFNQLKIDYGFGQYSAPQKLGKKFWAQLFFAAAGGALYLISAEEARNNYYQRTINRVYFSWIFYRYRSENAIIDHLYLGLVNWSGCIVNFLFNAESYMTVFSAMRNSTASELKVTGIKNEWGQWTLAWIASVFTILPTWFISLNGELGGAIFATASALANCPVNADGAKSLIDWGASINYTPRLKSAKENALLKARNALVADLRKRADKIPLLSAQELNNYFDGDADHCLDAVLAIDVTDFERPREFGCLKRSVWLLLATLGFIGIYQNYGGAYDSFQAGAELGADIDSGVEKPAGIVSTISYLLPSIGFSIKGLVKCVYPLIQLKNTPNIAQMRHAKAYYGFLAAAVFFATFSGFTTDEMGKEVWRWWPNVGGENGAFVSGIVSNFGAAFIYNLPQVVLFVSRAINLYIEQRGSEDDRKALQLSGKVRSLADTIQKMPAGHFERFVQDNQIAQHESIKTILQGHLSDEECSAIGFRAAGDA